MTVEEYLAKAGNVKLDAAIKLYLSKTKKTIYQKIKGRSVPTTEYFVTRAWFKKWDPQSVTNIWIYLHETNDVVSLDKIESAAAKFVRDRQVAEEARKQDALSSGNHSYNLEAFLNDR